MKGLKIVGEQGYYTGLSITSVGDVNKDSLADLVIGAIPYPDRFTKQPQKSYVIAGSNTPLSTVDVNLGDVNASSVVHILGGGFVVSGPGDVNEDGIDDIMITNFKEYVGKGNAYIISYPPKLSSPPTFRPSSFPSSPPSCYSSKQPSCTHSFSSLHPSPNHWNVSGSDSLAPPTTQATRSPSEP